MRIYSIIRVTDLHPPTRHFEGFPAALARDGRPPQEMPWPCVAIIEERTDGIFMDRYAADGSSAGDTWHQSIDDAKDQAVAEYAGMLGEWEDLPEEMSAAEAVAFALKKATSTK